jgi:hypothetical protein
VRKWQKITGAKDRRVYERTAVFIRASLETPNGELRAFLRNISRSGALLDGENNLATNTPVTLRCGDFVMPARVAWARPKRIGLAFSEVITDEQVAAFVGSKSRRAATA